MSCSQTLKQLLTYLALQSSAKAMYLPFRHDTTDTGFRPPIQGKTRIKVVKLLSVSTGQLRRLHALHRRPINLVVYQGTSRLSSNET